MNIIAGLPPHLLDNTYVSIDSEWSGLDENKLHRPVPSAKFEMLTMCAGEDVYYIQDQNLVAEALQRLDNCVWLMHNAKFDLTHLRTITHIKPRTKLVDTMLMEKILFSGYYDTWGLDALTRRYCGEFLDKSLQKSFVGGNLSEAQIEYACKDAYYTQRVWQEQRKGISQNDMKIWREIDLPALWAVLDFQGFRIDTEKWEILACLNEERQKEIDAQLPFNPRSPSQVVKALQQAGFKSISSSGEDILEEQIRKHPDTEAAKLAQMVLDSRMYCKRASSYGHKFLEKYAEQKEGSSYVYTNYNLIGAETGRFSSDDPNMQNIPARETLEYRECFVPRDGNVLVIGDWSQQEVFILAYAADDKKMKDLCNSGKDIYIGTAKMMYGIDIEKDDPIRKRMKTVVLGTDYGMSEFGLARKEKISVEEAKELIGKFYKAFPRVAQYIQDHLQEKKMVTTIAGRKIHLNQYSNQCGRNALNGPIQGTGCDMLKKSLAKAYQEWPLDYPFSMVEVTHDEMGCDVPVSMAEEAKEFIERCMVEEANKMCPGMNFKAEVKICGSWAQAK